MSAAAWPQQIWSHISVLMGPDAPTKVANMIEAITTATLAPVEVICRRS